MSQYYDLGRVTGGFIILGYFASTAALTEAISAPEPGDAYGVGESAPYDIYVWDGINQQWRNNGPLLAYGEAE